MTATKTTKRTAKPKRARAKTPKPPVKAASEKTVATTRTVPAAELVAKEAFLIWEAAGHPDGQQLTHWLEAERRLGS